eukprot:8968541-Pyramimonas_sp.AAC.1
MQAQFTEAQENQLQTYEGWQHQEARNSEMHMHQQKIAYEEHQVKAHLTADEERAWNQRRQQQLKEAIAIADKTHEDIDRQAVMDLLREFSEVEDNRRREQYLACETEKEDQRETT